MDFYLLGNSGDEKMGKENLRDEIYSRAARQEGFITWVWDPKQIEISGDNIIVGTSSGLFSSSIEKYIPAIEQAARDAGVKTPNVSVVVGDKYKRYMKPTKRRITADSEVQKPPQKQKVNGPFTKAPRSYDSLTFVNHAGIANASVLQQTIKQFRESGRGGNALRLEGQVGTGKTDLMARIFLQVMGYGWDARYIDINMLSELLQTNHRKGRETDTSQLSSCKWLFIDGAEGLYRKGKGRQGCIGRIRDAFNGVLHRGNQIVVAYSGDNEGFLKLTDRLIADDWADLADRLKETEPVCLFYPRDRKDFMRNFIAKSAGIDPEAIDKEVLNYVVSRLPFASDDREFSVRELRGHVAPFIRAINKGSAASLETALETAGKVYGQQRPLFNGQSPHEVVLARATNLFGVSIEKIIEGGRTKPLPQVVAWVSSVLRGISEKEFTFPRIGLILNRNHSTIVGAVKRFDQLPADKKQKAVDLIKALTDL